MGSVSNADSFVSFFSKEVQTKIVEENELIITALEKAKEIVSECQEEISNQKDTLEKYDIDCNVWRGTNLLNTLEQKKIILSSMVVYFLGLLTLELEISEALMKANKKVEDAKNMLSKIN